MNIINLRNYGNLETLKNDSKSLESIINNQGMAFVVDVIANHIGESSIKFKLDSAESQRLASSVIKDLEAAISERI